MSWKMLLEVQMDVENAISVSEWDDPSVYTPEHLLALADITRYAPLKGTM